MDPFELLREIAEAAFRRNRTRVSLHPLGLLIEQFGPRGLGVQRILTYEQVRYGGLPFVETNLNWMDEALADADAQDNT